MRPPRKIVAMASGGGRTVLNLHDALRASQLDSEVEFQHVFVSRPGVAAVERCRAIGMQVHLPDGAVDAAATAFLHSTDPDMVLLCGYLRWLDIPETLKNRVLNIHPSLLPRHGGKGMHGMHVHEAVLQAGDASSGCTVHLVDEAYDRGPIVLQQSCPVEPGDDAETLAGRVFDLECLAFPAAVRHALEGRLQLQQGAVETASEGERWPHPLFWRA